MPHRPIRGTLADGWGFLQGLVMVIESCSIHLISSVGWVSSKTTANLDLTLATWEADLD